MSSATTAKFWLRKAGLGVSLATALASAMPAAAIAAEPLTKPAIQSDLVTSTLLIDVSSAGDRLVAVGQRGHIIYSDDGGKTWEQADVPVNVLLTAVHFPDAENGWAVGHSGIILHSSDSGRTWTKQFDGDDANELVITESKSIIEELEAALAAQEDGADADASAEDAGSMSELEIQLEDAQYNLEDAQEDAKLGPTKPLLDVWFQNSQRGFAVGSYGFFFKTEDGGETWQNYSGNIDNLDRFHLNAINQVAGGTIYIAGEGGIVFRSVDAGDTWQTMESPYDGSFFAVTGTGNVNEVLLLGLRGNMFLSTDNGESWDEVNSQTDATLTGGMAQSSGRIVVVGNSGVMLFSSDHGRTFRARIRDDRLSLTSAWIVNEDKVLITGESGVSIMNGISKI
ncbi:WD40/YVTN/BNR-like repeat-containing protein [Allohahella marinimesophila]|uniref:YCF48-related protein n=1 Tax=Allohahella marinimesophila TaxID=1054972 RepID=A0ABP7NJW4_9GAMM